MSPIFLPIESHFKKEGEELSFYNNLEIIQHEKLHQCGDKKLPLSSYESEIFFHHNVPERKKISIMGSIQWKRQQPKKEESEGGKERELGWR